MGLQGACESEVDGRAIAVLACRGSNLIVQWYGWMTVGKLTMAVIRLILLFAVGFHVMSHGAPRSDGTGVRRPDRRLGSHRRQAALPVA
jgi:hypothetical protein